VIEGCLADVLPRDGNAVGNEIEALGETVLSRDEQRIDDASGSVVVVDQIDQTVGRGREFGFAGSNPKTVSSPRSINEPKGMLSFLLNTFSKSYFATPYFL
jgi:hypothetical protein